MIMIQVPKLQMKSSLRVVDKFPVTSNDLTYTCPLCKRDVYPVKIRERWSSGRCQCEIERAKQKNLAKQMDTWIQKIGVPTKLTHVELQAFESHENPHALEATQNFIEQHLDHCIHEEPGMNLILHSLVNGVGKTMLSVCIIKELLKYAQKYTSDDSDYRNGIYANRLAHIKFVRATDLYRMSFAPNNSDERSEWRKHWESLKTCQLLVIDDAGKEPQSSSGSTWSSSYYFEIFDARYAQELSTIITTNSAINTFCGDLHGNAIKDRVAETGYYVTMKGKSHRTSKVKALHA